jgi:hypothetical protein
MAAVTSDANDTPEEVREALTEMQLYFSDRVPPLTVGESLALLMGLPAGVLAQEIQSWVAGQFRATAGVVPTAEYLFHALRKIYAVGEFQLVPAGQFTSYIEELARAVLELCPPADRELLKASLARLGDPESATATPVAILHRADTPPPLTARTSVADPHLTQEVALGLRRFSLLLERLEHEPVASRSDAAPAQGQLVSQLVSSAAVSSASQRDLDEHLERLRQLGMGGGTDEMFRVLGGSLPGWVLPEAGGGFAPPASGSQAEAMERIVALSKEDPAESAKRFRQMVQVAIDQFNEGSLARAITILEIAQRVAQQKLVHSTVVERVRTTIHEKLDPDRLRKLAESPEKRPQLKKVMGFFLAFSPQGLLDSLRSEPKRDRRRLMLALLEAHGLPARMAALARLEASLRNTQEREDPQFQRNLLYILRLIPHPPDAPWDAEMELLRQLARSSSPSFLVKEVTNNLGRVLEESHLEKAERVLVLLLRGLERMLLRQEMIYPPEDTLGLLDRTISVLARHGGPSAWAEVADHGLSAQAELGDTGARLAELGAQDLSAAPEVLRRLTEVLATELPRSALAPSGKKEAWVVSLIRALSGTPAPPVRELFRDIATRYATRPTGQEAAKYLAGFDAAASPIPTQSTSLSGDLEVFGLSTLLQNMADLKATGNLTLLDVEGRPAATLLFERGKLASCQAGKLTGREALFELFEKPFTGTFGLVRRAQPEPPSASAEEVLPLVLEAIRRYDELQRATALVPDEACFVPTGVAPTRPPDESDQAFWEVLWDRVGRGFSARRCEAEMPVDSYRVRHLLEHWLQEGALQRRVIAGPGENT